MPGPAQQPDVDQLVTRFLDSRRSGHRISIDDVLDQYPDLIDRTGTRATALRRIAQQTLSLHAEGSDAAMSVDECEHSSIPGLPQLAGYDIVDRIGRGGMGVVYEAYQHSTGQRVAIKYMLERTSSQESAQRRFEREVELVARLEHPNIVSIIDSGVHRSRHYFVMHYVEGAPLDAAMKPGEESVRKVLHLIRRICEAVDYAHQRGVIHRDLKPSNILIDQRGEPRLLDFGLAKALEPGKQVAVAETLSQPGQILGTLAYMSPEQSRGEFDKLSVRTDVYSLGALAYELVTGHLPCRMDGALVDILDRISNIDAPNPSVLRRELDRDLDAVLLKAVAKEPHRRYATAGEFAADLERYLDGRPVTARRIGALGRGWRWARRNRAVATIATLACVVLVAVSAVSLRRITYERDVATELATQIDQTLAALTPDEANTIDVSLPVFYKAQAQRIAQNPPRYPQVAAVIHSRLGNNYRNLKQYDLYDEADGHLSEALRIRQEVLPRPHIDLAQSYHDLAALRFDQGDYAAAKELYAQALSMRIALHGSNDDEVGDTLTHLAAVQMVSGELTDAEQRYREVLELRKKLHDGEHVLIASAMNNLATCLRRQQRFAEAEPLIRESLNMLLSLEGENHKWIPTARHNYATCLMELGRLEKAEQLLRQAIEAKRRRYGTDNDSVASSLYQLAKLKEKSGDFDEARRVAHDTLDIQEKSLPADHADVEATRAMIERLAAGG